MAANSQNLCRLLDDLIRPVFDEEYLAVIPGVSASVFSSLPWDHLVFTGTAETGKKVMAAAANLTPVTLELGGKSPTIICEDYDLEEAAKRILFTKFLNAGQTCVAPDYVLVPENSVAEFVAIVKKILPERFESIQSQDFTSIIDEKSYARLISTIADAKSKGADVINLLDGEISNTESRKISPHLLVDVSDEMIVMQE